MSDPTGQGCVAALLAAVTEALAALDGTDMTTLTGGEQAEADATNQSAPRAGLSTRRGLGLAEWATG